MSRKGLLLFLATGFAWCIPYFFIAIAVKEFSTETIVLARVLIGAAVLIPVAIRQKALMPALRAWRWVLLFAALEIVGPWWLITSAERGHITSGLAGLLVATVPFFAVIISFFFLGDKSVLHPKTIFGLVVGFLGVFLLVGIDSFTGHVDPLWVGAVIVSAIGYAIAPAMASVKLKDVPTVGIMSLSLVIVAIIYAVPASFKLPAELAAKPSVAALISLLVLGVVCSAVAFVIFFELIREIGSARSTLVTYMNTLVAFALGILFLAEPITTGMMIGFPLVLVGSYFASRKH